MASREFDLSAFRWRKSSYSNGDGGSCVEIGTLAASDIVPVRDTKRAPTDPVLVFPATQWARFVTTLHNGHRNA
ncbi:DUF397 domain-containing protein [Streptomyces sp. WMMB303]|uniref:DUF397 domain-containing protein n=1 Tax=unclassified Streptomyces TaxID=2593676 RepID=UPI0023EADECB|nr:DUF397 domain-containing protein [Streptomyces sp. WMMB303]MDF4252781.1 DUF397 domain-containing protein [Streptomyces sp. WMMB303]